MDRRGVEKNIFTKWNLNKVKNQTRAHGKKAAKCHVLKTEGSRRHLMFLLPISFKVLPKPQPLGQKWAKSPLTGTMSHRRNNQAKESQASQLKHRPEDMVTKTCIWGFAFAMWCQVSGAGVKKGERQKEKISCGTNMDSTLQKYEAKPQMKTCFHLALTKKASLCSS